MKLSGGLILITVCALGGVSGIASSEEQKAATSSELLNPAGVSVGWDDFASPSAVQGSFAEQLAAITDKASRDLLDVPADPDQMRQYLDGIAWKVRGRIASGGARETAEAIAEVLFDEEKFVPDEDATASSRPETAVLSSVIQNKHGVCLSLSLIYLAVADEASIPLHGVSVPTHFFVRYEDAHDRLNIETLKRGTVSNSDAFYRKTFFVRKGEPFYLKNLSQKEALATYVSQLAAIYTRRGMADQAVELLKTALQASPTDPEIRTNLGVALQAAGHKEDALRAFWSAVILDPYDDVAHYHLARGLADREEWLAAVYHLDESMRLGHSIDLKLLRKLESHRPDAIPARTRQTPVMPASEKAGNGK